MRQQSRADNTFSNQVPHFVPGRFRRSHSRGGGRRRRRRQQTAPSSNLSLRQFVHVVPGGLVGELLRTTLSSARPAQTQALPPARDYTPTHTHTHMCSSVVSDFTCCLVYVFRMCRPRIWMALGWGEAAARSELPSECLLASHSDRRDSDSSSDPCVSPLRPQARGGAI